MRKLRLFQITAVFTVLLMSITTSPSILSPNPGNNIQVQALNSGSLNGIDYSYGNRTFSASGNITRMDNGTVTEFLNQSRTVNRTLALITDFAQRDLFYLFEQTETTADNRTFYTERYFNNATFQFEINFINNTLPLIFNPFNYTDGYLQMDPYYEANVSSADAYAVSTRGEFLAQFPVQVDLLEYNFKYANGTVTRKSTFIIPQVWLFWVQKMPYNVSVTQTEYQYAQMAYYVRYSKAYNITANAYQVNITNGINFALQVDMFDQIEANYTESIITALYYNFISYQFTQIKFANGTDVPYDMYPRNMLPVMAQSTGTMVEAGLRHISSKLVSTLQSVTSVFATVADTSTTNTTSLEARLAVWSIQSMTTMAAYSDGNANGKLDLTLGADGLGISSTDRLEYLGLTEAFETTVVNAYYKSHVYNESVNFFGLGVNINNTNVNDTRFVFDVQQYGYGDINSAYTSVFYWSTPVAEADGSVTFDFGIDYLGFPVTWINMTNPANSFSENQDIGYYYIVNVDPVTGRATISPTWLYGGITDPTLRSAMEGLSLATMIKSEFFAVQAIYTATATNETLNASSSREFDKISVSTGGGNATEIDVTGPKQYYMLNGTTNTTASFDAINLIQVSGSFEAEQTTPFSSESDNTAGDATTGTIVETLSLNFFYSSSLILISYPEWNGLGIVHDPDYNVEYEPIPQQTTTTTTSTSTPTTTTTTSTSTPTTTTTTSTSTPTTTSTTSTTTSTSTSTSSDETSTDSDTESTSDSTTTEPTTPVSSTASAPAFQLIVGFVAITVFSLYRRKRI